MKISRKTILVICILIIAAVLRFVQLGQVPVSLDWDEVALGYNAYSVLKTGRDEYGTWLPLTLRSFDDYKPPLYMYLTIPSVAVFGLTPFAVRFPSAIAGIFAVFGTYYMVSQFGKTARSQIEKQKLTRMYEALPFVSSFLLAISPWHLQFSRIAFEANIGLCINIWIVFFFLKGLHEKRHLIYAAFLSGMALYAYHSERVFVPLLVLALFVLFFKKIIAYKYYVLVPLFVGIITLAPLIHILTDKTTLMRLKGTSSLSDQTGLLSVNVTWLADDAKRNDMIGTILDNRRFVWAKTILSGYLSHFSLKWWFIQGDNPRHHAPDMGMLYLWELPFLFLGLYLVAVQKTPLRNLLFCWVLIAPIAASVTTELPHGIRTLVFLPTFQIFTAMGVLSVYNFLKNHRIVSYTASSILYGIFIVFNCMYYLNMYYVQMNREYSDYWQYGYEKAVSYAKEHADSYKKIVVSTKLEQPYMFFLFYLKYDPAKYLQAGGTKSGGFAEYANAFDKYEFRPIQWDKEKHDGTVLYIGKPSEIQGSVLYAISYLNGDPAIEISDK